MTENPLLIVQARTGSTRLPGKVLARIEDHSLLEYVLRRCLMSKRVAAVVLATSELLADDPVATMGQAMGVKVFRGSEADVLDRYVRAAEAFGAEVVVRITADCPLIDPRIIDETVAAYQASPADYVHIAGYPNGVGAVEVLRLSALHRAWRETTPTDTYYREHVMTYLTDHPEIFSVTILQAPSPLHRPDIRLSVDEAADLETVRKVCHYFQPRLDFSASEIIACLDRNPSWGEGNAHVQQKTR